MVYIVLILLIVGVQICWNLNQQDFDTRNERADPYYFERGFQLEEDVDRYK